MIKAIEAAIAANRFGLGARPGDIAALGDNGRDWLLTQLTSRDGFRITAPGLPDIKTATRAVGTYIAAIRQRRADNVPAPASEAQTPEAEVERLKRPLAPLTQIALHEGAARLNHALTTSSPCAERLAGFWTNHFTVSATKALTIALVGVFEREAIRDNLGGSFSALLLAAARHPGMLFYLDQVQSVGPNSPLGLRRESGLNENLARELLELHTLGAQGGYTQSDVTELAKALTGWSIAGPRTRRFAPNAADGEFVFVPAMHEPGARTLLGKRYGEGGTEQGEAMLGDLARHPATARTIAMKLAKHFVADSPPGSAVAKLETAFRQTDGDLPSLHRAVVSLPEAWDTIPQKFKSPLEFMLSGLRLVGARDVEGRAMAAALELLGQPLFRAPSPEGWPDDAGSWLSPDAIMKRLEWSQALAAHSITAAAPETILAGALGPLVRKATLDGVSRAENGVQGLTLALMSPEFQRR